MKYNRETRARFWDKVNIKSKQECWEWTGWKSNQGYGKFYFNKKDVYAHRFCSALTGNDPAGMCVLHSCDNTSCVNPDHLRLGTQQDNMDDKVQRGRGNWCNPPKGVRNAHAKLTEAEVIEIRKRLTSVIVLANKYNVNVTTIYSILSRKNWKHI